MVKKLQKRPRSRTTRTARLRKPAINEEEERILTAATLELITHHGGLLVATDLRKIYVREYPVWIITVTLRYPTGFEGYVGDMLYDEEKFTWLTEQSVRKERVQKIAADPEGIRQWNEFRASTLRSGKAQ